jgi:arsenate reductase
MYNAQKGVDMSDFTIYHNPRCSKSRQTLQLLQDNGVDPEIVLYLDNTPSAEQLDALLAKLNISPRDLLRKGEDDYKALNLKDASHSDADIVAAMVAHPKLIERPIVVKGDRAVLGRPPENVLELL